MTLREFLHTVKLSLKDQHHDFTRGDLSQAVILLAVPMILELSLESIFAVVDMFFVSRLGANAIATVGLTESVVTLVYSIAIGISAGATAIVSRRVGEKNPVAAAHAGAQAIVITFFLSLIISVVGIVFAGDILKLMGASPEVIAEGKSFTQILIGGNLVILLLFLINGIFRGAGNATIAMKSLWIASGVNIILCPILIHFFGLSGAAIATVIGRASGVIYQCRHLFSGQHVVKITLKDFGIDMAAMNAYPRQRARTLLNISFSRS